VDLNGKVIALTGAGAGLGRALALELARRGTELALSDLREDGVAETAKLVEAAGGRCRTRIVDVSDPGRMDAWAGEVAADHGTVDGLVNNAGLVLPWRPMEEVPYDDLRRIVEVNLWGQVHGARSFLPLLKTRPQAALVNVASLASYIAFPDQAGYCLSKYALRGFSESLRAELAGTPVRLTLVCPGGIRDTDIMRNALGGTAAEAAVGERLTRMPLTTGVAAVAKRIADGMEQGRPRLVVGGDAKIMNTIARLFPARYPALLAPAIGKYQRQFRAARGA
jgi:NAD(P)-dependent dehydrogenase (short-subunit alcohol dehydrogenase family)